MEHDLVLEGRVVTPTGVQETEVGIDDGLVAEIDRGLKAARRIKTGRSLIFPGFIDMHVHLREPGREHKEDFRTGTRAAVHGGVTTVVDMPNNTVPATTRAVIETKERLAEAKAVVDVRFYGGVVHGDLGRLRELADRVVGFKLYLSRTTGASAFPGEEMRNAFEAISALKKPVSMHCEDQAIIERAERDLVGVTRPDVHCDRRPPQAEVESVANAAAALRGLTELRANVCHASTAGALEVVKRAKGDGLHLSCEAALHYLYYNRRAMFDSPLLKTNPPLRSEEDRQALLSGVKNGEVSFLVTDHAPHTEQEKAEGASGVPGLDDYGHVVSWLIRNEGVEPLTIGKVASANPAKFAGLTDRGEIALGKRADFAVLDLTSPEKVENDDILSKCGWSPYEGKEFPGRVRWTVRGGDLLLDDFEMAA
jgi:dihydroorotase (multifunctional complex type)